MATRSFLKTVRFSDKKLSRSFVSALENAKGKKSKTVELSRACETVKRDKIKNFFGD